MGYIEFFYKKFPGKSNDFQGGAMLPWGNTKGVGDALKQHRKPAVFEENQWGRVIFMESAFAEIVKKSVGDWV